MTRIFFLIVIMLFTNSCELSDRDLLAPVKEENKIDVKIAKWFNNHKAAISLTYDKGLHSDVSSIPFEADIIKKYEMILDCEIVTAGISDTHSVKNNIANLRSKGIGFFGHGHEHINHDKVGYKNALASFRRCFDSMQKIGLNPISYAYPGGHGYSLDTRRALKNAGFLSGRKFEQLDILDPHILPNNELVPKDWYFLPSVVMQSVKYDGCEICINNTDELIPILDDSIEMTSWIILTYHNIGGTEGYGFYEIENFETDLIEIKKRDFWVGHLDDITLYARERYTAEAEVFEIKIEDRILKYNIFLEDDLDDDIYNHELTLMFKISNEWLEEDLVLKQGDNIVDEYNFKSADIQIAIPPNGKEYCLELK